MGTSSSYKPPRTIAWRHTKSTVTRLTRSGELLVDEAAPRQVTNSYVQALGGSRLAAEGMVAGRAAAARLAGFLTTMSAQGITAALNQIGLAHLVGRDIVDVLAGLTDRLSGPGRTLEEAATRAAMLATLTDEFSSIDYLSDLDAGAISRVLGKFLLECVYARMVEALADSIERGAISITDAYHIEQGIHSFIFEAVQLELALIDPLDMDWTSAEADELIQRLLVDAYSQLE
jgi:hypothetical protein